MNNSFLSKENIATIWEVIRDEDIFKFLTLDFQENIFQMFISNIKLFYEAEKDKNIQLFELNKKYILLILNYIRNKYPQKLPTKIKIFKDEPEKELITFEELQNDRKSQFEKDLIKKQEEFENSINIKPPPVPNFSENFEDKPISEMDLLIKEITSKRNYDIEKLNYNYLNNTIQDNNWLKSQETSIKSETFSTITSMEENEKNNNIQKNVTWGENKEFEYSEEKEIDLNIFQKLKKIENNQGNNLEERIYFLENEMKQINLKLNNIIEIIKDK